MDQDIDTEINRIADKLEPEVIELRRSIHSCPEVGWCEYITKSIILRELEKTGWSVKFDFKNAYSDNIKKVYELKDNKLAEKRALAEGVDAKIIKEAMDGYLGTGVIAEMDSGRPGPTVAFRFDMDALFIEETKSPSHAPNFHGFSSKFPELMHACGHDGHVAIGLGLAKVLNIVRKRLCGKFRLVFQPAEEGCRGAQFMVESGAMVGVDYLIGLHIGVKARKTGEIYAGSDGFLATHKFDVKFMGRSAHAGIEPEAGRNALLAAAEACINIYNAQGDNIANSRANVGFLTGGKERNIIPSRAFLKGETRGLNDKIEENMYENVKKCVDVAAQRYNVTYKISLKGWAPSAESDEDIIPMVVESSAKIPEIKLTYKKLSNYGASDDFTIMMRDVQRSGGKACFICLGSDLAGGHHQENFDFDEKCLIIGVKLLSNLVKTIGQKKC